MKNLTPVGTTFPAPRSFEDGDELDQANLDEAFQAAANRAQYLLVKHAEIENVVLGDGVPKIRAVASSAALKALADVTAGEIALISPGSNVSGLYVFASGAAPFADRAGWLYASTAELGYWMRDIGTLATLDAAEGIARFDDSRVVVPNRLKDLLRYSSSEVDLGENASWQHIVSSSSLTLAIGDKVLLSFSASAKNTDATNAVGIRVAVTDPASSTADVGTSAVTYDFYANNKRQHVGAQGLFTAAAAGNHTFRAQALLTPGGGPYNVVFGKPSLQVTCIRP